MGFKSAISNVLFKLKTATQRAWKLLQDAGLDDEVLDLALRYVKTASTRYVDNNERREWVVRILMDHKVPQGIARVATEMAYKLFQAELKKLSSAGS